MDVAGAKLHPERESRRALAGKNGSVGAVAVPPLGDVAQGDSFLMLIGDESGRIGVHEMAEVTDKVAVLIQPELLGVAEGDRGAEIALMSLGGNLHGAFGWTEQTELRLGLLTPKSIAAFEGEGYRVIRVIRHPESEQTPLPWEAVPVVVAEALAGARPTFWVNVTPYLNLKEITLPEILATLTELFA